MLWTSPLSLRLPSLQLKCLVATLWLYPLLADCMRVAEVAALRQQTRDLFYHGYTNYMQHAFPEDELKPLSCRPQTRNREDPADIGLNDVLGNYSLTLIDSLSTLAILASGSGHTDKHNSLKDFQDGVQALVELYGSGTKEHRCGKRACGFDLDSKVQVFETNIRGVGGLLSAHLFAIGALPIKGYEPDQEHTEDGREAIRWHGFVYDGQLLRLAKDLATRLLPAFNTETGLPYPRVNLRRGAYFYADSEDAMCRPDGSSTSHKDATETCAAGAGSLVLEFATLSRLTGDDKFEILAKRAFWAVWERRSTIGLVGNGVDAETGQWTQPSLAGIGAGIDSFYEYAVKSSILLSGISDDTHRFWSAWQTVHAALKHHVLRSGHLEKYPFYGQSDQYTGASRFSWIDNLSAYYPGLLTVAGELDEAIESHLLFAALWTRYAALPERWLVHNGHIDPNFKHWAGRPEFIESTYYLHQATKDPFYLHTGEMALRDIRRRCWTKCGWADLRDVLSGEKRDRMESFFLGETAKYLYLLFEEDHPLNKLDAPVVFTTEGHPLVIPRHGQYTSMAPSPTRDSPDEEDRVPSPQSCPVPNRLPALTGSSVVSRKDFFHAAAMAQLHLVPVQPARSSALLDVSEHSPGISIADITSPTNYTFYPWTLPQGMIPPSGFSAPLSNPTISTLTFPAIQLTSGEGSNIAQQPVHKFLDGILVSSLSNLKLNMVQEPRSVTVNDAHGISVEMDLGPQYRVHGVANWALGRDEKVILTREALDGVAPGDPNFRKVKDLEMIDLVLDYTVDQDVDKTSTSDGSKPSNTRSSSLGNATDYSPFDSSNVASLGIIRGHETSTAAASPVRYITPPKRTIVPAILPTGIGAAPLPAIVDSLDTTTMLPGKLPFSSVYFLDDTLCPPNRLPARIAKEYQVLIIMRGGCSFNDKLTQIPSFVPALEALQVVILVSTHDVHMQIETAHGNTDNAHTREGLVRPLIEEKQTSPSGFERRHGIAMVMLSGTEEIVRALRSLATTHGTLNSHGSLEERHISRVGHNTGIGIKRRYWFESMGVPIGNLIAL